MSSPKIALLPYKHGSNSATLLVAALNQALQLKRPVRKLFTDERGTLVAKPENNIINWGSSSAPDRLARATWINHPDKVATAGNKLFTFLSFQAHREIDEPIEVNYPEFTARYEDACEWVTSGITVVCRTKLNGHSGAGIVLAAREEDVVRDCPLYVKYVKKAKEFRIHVAFGEVIDVQAKRKRADYEGETDYAIRNHHTGWVYCRENIEEPTDLREQALRAIQTLGLDFGAVDIIYNQHYNKCYVLEVNTAPGLEGQTVTSYTQAFTKHFS
jgi:glutathione synthase/RimK-type ligase-like ATP-grasp enzyme